MKRLFFYIFFFPVEIFAQSKGIQFEQKLSWTNILLKAKTENKIIFVDCYATWCAPCKIMEQQVFANKEVIEFFNNNFINVKVQMDSTKSDSSMTKIWYTVAYKLKEHYEIKELPTFLFIASEGHILHKIIGANTNIKSFLEESSNSLDPNKQYYTLLKAYNSGKRDSIITKRLAIESKMLNDSILSEKFSKLYIKSLSDPFNKENISFIKSFTTSSKDIGFNIFFNNSAKIDSIMGSSNYSQPFITNIIIKENNLLFFLKDRTASQPNWNLLYQKTRKKYNVQVAERILIWCKVIYFQSREMWPSWSTMIIKYVEKYGKDFSAFDLNNYAWDVFSYGNDKNQLKIAALWARRILDNDIKGKGLNSHSSPPIDTYANLQYKAGNIDEAIFWEKKAVALSPDNEGIRENLNKMLKGQKTW